MYQFWRKRVHALISAVALLNRGWIRVWMSNYIEIICLGVISDPNPTIDIGLATLFEPLRAKFFRENINIYLHFVSYLHIDTTQIVEILPQIRQEYLFYIVNIMAADALAT